MSELPQGWVNAALDDIAIVNPGRIEGLVADMSVSFVPMSAVSDVDGEIVNSTVRLFAEVSKGYTQFREGDVIFAKITPCMENGKIAVARSLENGVACGSTEFHVVRPLAENSPDYIWRFLRQNSYRSDAEAMMTGAVGQRRVSAAHLKDSRVPLPPLPEQRRIVAKIDSLTGKSRRARDHLDHIPRLVEKYKQAVLAAAFRGDLTREWDNDDSVTNEDYDAARLTLCAELKCRPWKLNETAPEVRNAPVRWRRCYVGQLVAHRSGIAFESKDFSASGTQVVRLGNLYQARLDLTRQPVFLASEEKYSPFLAQGGDILVSQTGTKYKRDYGHFVIVPEDTRLLVNQRVVCLTPTEHLNVAFLSFFSQTNEFRDYFFSHETGGVSQGNVGLAGIMDAPLALPSRAEQDEIVRRIKLAYSAIDRLASEATSARRLIDWLDQSVLAKAFRGELVPQDPEDEPASMLLDRIRAERGAGPKTRRGRRPVA